MLYSLSFSSIHFPSALPNHKALETSTNMNLLSSILIVAGFVHALPWPTSPQLPSTMPQPEPERCGGFTINPHMCPLSTQICYNPVTNIPDLPGYCIGESCGGNAPWNHKHSCPRTMVCAYLKPQVNDAPGKCVLASMTCGPTKKCPESWVCVPNAMNRDCRFRVDATCEGLCYPLLPKH